MFQPFLFAELETITEPPNDARKAGTSVINRLLIVRRSLAPDEQDFEAYISKTVKEIRSIISLSFSQKEELILLAIERQMARTVGEIQEDTRLPMKEVKEIVSELVEKKVLRWVQRYVPNDNRKQFFIKSNRIKDVEVD